MAMCVGRKLLIFAYKILQIDFIDAGVALPAFHD